MLSLYQARQLILRSVGTLGAEPVELLEALGRVSAEDVLAPFPLPLFDNSSMDGYAVRMDDAQMLPALSVHDFVPAGDARRTSILPGSAVKVMTGAPVPEGCEAVVPIEEIECREDGIHITVPPRPGQHIRHAGEDFRKGEVALATGTTLRVPEISLLASLGRTSVSVYRRPRVAILATGDELVEPGQPLAAGKLYNSNSLALATAVLQTGAVPVLLGIAADNRESLHEKLLQALRADVLITAAGVSVGDRDLVRDMLAEMGVQQLFWGIAVKPGKSTAFGMKGRIPVFSLPGNPVSTIVSFEELVRPALCKMLGRSALYRPALRAVLMEPVRKVKDKTQLLRVSLCSQHGRLLARSAGNQDTRFLRTLLNADGLAELPAGRDEFAAGDEIQVRLLGEHLSQIPDAAYVDGSAEDAPRMLCELEAAR